MMRRPNYCRECMAHLVVDYQSGELICSRCGIVAQNAPDDDGPENRISEGLPMRMVRASGYNTYSKHDLGIATAINKAQVDFDGKPLNRIVRSQLKGMRRWQQRVRVSKPKDRRVLAALTSINDVCVMLGLGKNILESASILYRNVNNQMDLRGKSIIAVTSAIVYMACKQCGVVRSIEEIIAGVCPSNEVYAKTKLASKYYRMMVMETGSPRTEPMPLAKYISKISNMSETDVRAERMALHLADLTYSQTIMSGRDPHGIAAAYLFIACMLLGHENMQRDIAEAAGVTEVTARNRCKEIFAEFDVQLVLQPTVSY